MSHAHMPLGCPIFPPVYLLWCRRHQEVLSGRLLFYHALGPLFALYMFSGCCCGPAAGPIMRFFASRAMVALGAVSFQADNAS